MIILRHLEVYGIATEMNNNNSTSFKFKTNIGRLENNGTKNVKIRAPLKFLG